MSVASVLVQVSVTKRKLHSAPRGMEYALFTGIQKIRLAGAGVARTPPGSIRTKTSQATYNGPPHVTRTSCRRPGGGHHRHHYPPCRPVSTSSTWR
ncbi:MAG: hypothetical protein ACLT98_05210 [Eggerthellaceae bacterium]